MVAGFVVHVGPGVYRVPRRRFLGQRAVGEVRRLVPPFLLLPDEGEQPGVPPVVAVRRRQPLDERPGFLRYLGHTGERDRRYRDAEHERIPRVLPQVRLDRAGPVATDVRGDCGDLAAFPIGAPAGRGRGRRERGRHVDPGVPEREARIGAHRVGQVVLGAGLDQQDLAQARVVRRGGARVGGQVQPVQISHAYEAPRPGRQATQ